MSSHRMYLVGWLTLIMAWVSTAFGAEPFSRMWASKEIVALAEKNPEWRIYRGNPAERDWRSTPGLIAGFRYSGKGPLPKPLMLRIPLDPPLPAGSYWLSIRNFYVGTMQVSLGHETKTIRAPRYEWSPGTLFEVDPVQKPAEHIEILFFPDRIVQDSGEAQEQHYIVQGVFLTTDKSKVPSKDGEIIETLATEAPAPRQGNYLEDGSFETGLGHGWGKRLGHNWIFDAEHLDSTTAAHGKYCARIPLARVRNGYDLPFESKMYRLPPNRRFVLSFYGKADRPVRLKAGLQCMNTQLKGYASGGVDGTVSLDTEWRRYEIPGTTQSAPGFLYSVRFAAEEKEPGVVWLDGIQLEEGERASPYQPAEPVEVGYVTSNPGNIFHDNSPAELEVRIFNPTEKRTVALHHQVVDYWGNVIDEGRKDIQLADKNHSIIFPLFNRKRGVFRATFRVDGCQNQAELVYSVLPPSASLDKPFPEGSLGVDAPLDNEKLLRILKRANCHWVLSKHYARWYVAEPERGKFCFFDEEMKLAQRMGISVVLQTLNPDWGAQPWVKELMPAKGTRSWLPEKRQAFLDAWTNYVATLAAHYKSWVNHWEIENEPNAEYPPDLYAEMLKRGYAAIKSANPNAKVAGFSGGGFNRKFFDAVVEHGAMGACDIVSVHLYPGNNAPMRSFAEFVSAHKKVGWNTETGLSGHSYYRVPVLAAFLEKEYWKRQDEQMRQQTNVTVINYLSTVSAGQMERYFHYFCRLANTSPSQPTRWGGGCKEICEFDGALRPNGVGLSIASHFVDRAKYKGEVHVHDAVEAHVMQKGETGLGFMWLKERTPQDRAALLLSNRAVERLIFYDVMGNSLPRTNRLIVTYSPIYFTAPVPAEEAMEILKETRPAE